MKYLLKPTKTLTSKEVTELITLLAITANDDVAYNLFSDSLKKHLIPMPDPIAEANAVQFEN